MDKRPLVSILIPVGFAYDGIKECLESLIKNTKDFQRIEVLIKLDQGDKKNLEIVQSFQDRLPIKIVIMDGRGGYADLHLYTNTLAKSAQGEFIWWWSDEVRILTPDWDEIIEKECISQIGGLAKFDFDVKPVGGAKYPMLSHKWIEITGRWCNHPSIDSWVNTVAEKAGIYSIQLSIVIEDQNTLIESGIVQKIDQRKRKRLVGKPILGWESNEVQNDLMQDVIKLKKHLGI